MPDDHETAPDAAGLPVVDTEVPEPTGGELTGGELTGGEPVSGDTVVADPQAVPSPWETPPFLSYGLLVVVGLICAMFGVAIAPLRITVGGLHLPVGLLVVVAIPVIARAGAWLTGGRLGALAVALGWAVPTLAFAVLGPGGDVLLPDLARTWIYLGGTALLLILAVAVPLPRGARELAEARRTGQPDPTL